MRAPIPPPKPAPRWLACLLALLCALAAGAARADSPITLFKSFAGNVSFTGTQKTLRAKDNDTDPCALSNGNLTLKLTGVPSGATIVNAQLYWAGSGSTPDYSVVFDGVTTTAPSNRSYTSATVGYDFFAGAADVTSQVVAKGNANYTVSGLSINSGSPYCAVEGVLGGFQLLVVYSHPSETFRVLNVYEGFQYIRNSAVTLTLANFKIPTPIGSLTGKIGHITWEGDSTLSGGGEILRYNSVEMVDALNPSGNQFNSVSNINNDSLSYGIDFDAYTVSSPTIQAGQTQARSDYQSGQDLVLMNAEIIAAPNVPAADRAISMTLQNPLQPSQISSYIIKVSNNGPLAEGGPVTVVDVLPSSLIFVSAGGSGWACGMAGQTLTCSYSGAMAAGVTLPSITLRVTTAAAATGLVNNSATVGGQLFDYYDGNDTSTVSSLVGAPGFTPSYVFTEAKPGRPTTEGQCVNGLAFGDPGQTCQLVDFAGQRYLADKDIPMYLTFVVSSVPTALSNSNTTIKIKYALSCYDPAQDAGVRATFTLVGATPVTLPLCAASGALPAQTSSTWTGLNNVVMAGGKASSADQYNFHYGDVGRVEFLVSDNTARLGTSGPFVERPDRLVLTAPSANHAGMPTSPTDPKFVTAGTPFALTVSALMYTGVAAPNFGKETTPVVVRLVAQAAKDQAGNRLADMLADPAAPETELVLNGALGAFSGGSATGGAFSYADVGVLEITPRIAAVAPATPSYLNTGDVPSVSLNVGRFVPDHFDTVVTAPMACDPFGMSCPATVAGMAYSRQPFGVKVTAANLQGATTVSYRGALARAVQLSAWSAPGTAVTANPPASPSGSALSANNLAATDFGSNASNGGVANASPVYTFPNAYVATAPYANNWVAPTMVYLRASESGTPNDSVTSLRTGAVEGGVAVVAGRLFVPNAYGASNLPLSLQLGAQYYGQSTVGGATVRAWRNNASDSATQVTPASNLQYASCLLACPSPAANAPPTYTMSTGTATVSLKAGSAAGKSGASVTVVNGPLWLPTTQGRVTFGLYRSPVIFLREVY